MHDLLEKVPAFNQAEHPLGFYGCPLSSTAAGGSGCTMRPIRKLILSWVLALMKLITFIKLLEISWSWNQPLHIDYISIKARFSKFCNLLKKLFFFFFSKKLIFSSKFNNALQWCSRCCFTYEVIDSLMVNSELALKDHRPISIGVEKIYLPWGDIRYHLSGSWTTFLI